MNGEEFFEIGIVEKVGNGMAVVRLTQGEDCHHCGARLMCAPGEAQERSLTATDPIGVQPGDRVQVSISGRSVMIASFLLYGAPLILLLGGVFAGMHWFTVNPELFSLLVGIGLVALYTLSLYVFSRLQPQTKHVNPTIMSVHPPKEP